MREAISHESIRGFVKEVSHVSSTCCSSVDLLDSARWNIIQTLFGLLDPPRCFRARFFFFFNFLNYYWICFSRTGSSVKLPSHLWRTGLDNVPRAEFPQSVLNRHAPARPAPPLRTRPMERGGERALPNRRNGAVCLLCEFVCLINRMSTETQHGNSGEQFGL